MSGPARHGSEPGAAVGRSVDADERIVALRHAQKGLLARDRRVRDDRAAVVLPRRLLRLFQGTGCGRPQGFPALRQVDEVDRVRERAGRFGAQDRRRIGGLGQWNAADAEQQCGGERGERVMDSLHRFLLDQVKGALRPRAGHLRNTAALSGRPLLR
ncbi:hypothetical protein Tbd_0919 [Thiobacillus denitrificans ATCC 25259]|uniref:Uncharacterized protein n=1 Tax=Thiobacillus denitrificans (strain ATCC 25259 / T1) TaxID=292415 RepID=Q3SKB5_THIDA|nr:hypothetical protein Tbd_0919 [Thiobacillus denitrificans ATCC 25259]